jgi:hypothetical protein
MQDRGGRPALEPPLPPSLAGPETVPRACPGGRLGASLAGPSIALRPATPADAEFCYRLHKAAMGEYITAIWGWDEQVQRAFHQRAFIPHRWQIITAGQAGIGMLDVEYRPGEIYVSRIEIHPAIKARAPIPGSSARFWTKQSARARTWFSTCLRSTAARERSTGGSA